jgi:preprotein translocase subunit YajC
MENGIESLAGFVATSAASGGIFGGDMMSVLPFVAIIAIMYFLMIRPQQKKEKQRQSMVSALKRGDRVLTTGGLIGTIHKVVDEGELLVEIAEGTRVRLLSGAVSQLLDKTSTTPAKSAKAASSD